MSAQKDVPVPSGGFDGRGAERRLEPRKVLRRHRVMVEGDCLDTVGSDYLQIHLLTPGTGLHERAAMNKVDHHDCVNLGRFADPSTARVAVVFKGAPLHALDISMSIVPNRLHQIPRRHDCSLRIAQLGVRI